jgi:hypothetical protein
MWRCCARKNPPRRSPPRNVSLEPSQNPSRNRTLSSWSEFEAAEPEFSAAVKKLLDAHVHKTLATLRKDGSPRISGTELNFKEGEIWLGSMLGAVKALDLQRDPRYAVHSGSDDPPHWKGDVKFSGVVEEITDADVVARINGSEHAGKSHLFRCDISELSRVHLNEAGDALIIESWKPGLGIKRIERD